MLVYNTPTKSKFGESHFLYDKKDKKETVEFVFLLDKPSVNKRILVYTLSELPTFSAKWPQNAKYNICCKNE